MINATVTMSYEEFEKLRAEKAEQPAVDVEELKRITEFLFDGAYIDGGHHKQWFIVEATNRLVAVLGMEPLGPFEDEGVNP